MSRNFAVFKKAGEENPFSSLGGFDSDQGVISEDSLKEDGEYSDLIRKCFEGPIAVAIVGATCTKSGQAFSAVDRLAVALGNRGKRTVVVSLTHLLEMSPISVSDGMLVASNAPNVWRWPKHADQKLEFFSPGERHLSGTWLDHLRHDFDTVLLDCPHVDTAPEVTDIAVMADAVILLVNAEHTSKQQIQHNQRSLEVKGAKLIGCILVHHE